ncbi:hypothetical protein SAMN05421890_1735 [Ensifer adhaerens]|nr:hypothetical protein SAMN05421890_1735 [Ensifer adhaerens]HZG27207.1 DUF6656 family protein [Ensifer sp.]
MPVLRYFDSSRSKKTRLPAAVHSEFLRTGRILRAQDTWIEEEKRYLTYQEVAAITGKRLERAGETTHERLNAFHRAIQFPKLIFHRTLAAAPHLGYCHVTASKTKFAEYDDVTWGFYIANFLADIGTSGNFFEHINPRQGRMYFAVAMAADKSGDKAKLAINTAIRGNGLLFRTNDPKQAMKNVLMLGARNEQLRAIIRAIG